MSLRRTALIVLACALSVGAAAAPPRLVVQITIDGLPTENLLQHADRLRPDGLGRFFSEGILYTGAEYPYLTTFTAVGHASLFTGALPSMHGLIGNEWLDNETGASVYCVEDPAHRVLDFPTKEHEGTSPANLESSTIGDELVRASAGKSRVFSVSAKDRGAILPGGKMGKAFWYSKGANTFVTSDYYYPATPEWLKDWRERQPIAQYRHTVWELLRNREDYTRYNQDDRSWEKGLGPTFPHDLGSVEEAKLADAIRWTPYIDELTMSLALEIMVQEKLGQGEAADMLCVSLSAMDYVSHLYGPDGLEAEDTLYRADGYIAELLARIDEFIGLDHTLVVLSADHGFGRAPEECASEGLQATRVTKEDLAERVSGVRTALAERFGLDPKVVQGYMTPFLYLDRALIAQSGVALDDVQRAAADLMAQWPAVAWTATRNDLLDARLPQTKFHQLVGRLRRTKFHDRATVSLSTTRGGDVLVVLKPWCLIETPETAYPASHGSPYAYDTHVPILFLGQGVEPRRVDRHVSPLDIAATLAACLDITPPPFCTGEPLPEVL